MFWDIKHKYFLFISSYYSIPFDCFLTINLDDDSSEAILYYKYNNIKTTTIQVFSSLYLEKNGEYTGKNNTVYKIKQTLHAHTYTWATI